MLVSVIVPCHNRVKLLTECLESIRQQTYPAIEVIVVDDASTDDVAGTVAAIAWPTDKHATVMRSEQNIGPGAARELGRQAARGEFLCYQDSDDWWRPEKVAAQVEALQQNHTAGMCYCIARQFTALPIIGDEPVRSLSDRAYNRFLPMLLETQRRPWGTGACMWTRQAVELIGPWFPGWTWEDMEYDCRAGCHDIAIVHVAGSLCYYRTHASTNQLRRTDVAKRMRQMAASVLSISTNLADHGKLTEPRIAAAHQWLLYDHSVMLLRIGASDEADILVRRLMQTSSHKAPVRVAADALVRIRKVTRSPYLAGLIGRAFGMARQRLASFTGTN